MSFLCCSRSTGLLRPVGTSNQPLATVLLGLGHILVSGFRLHAVLLAYLFVIVASTCTWSSTFSLHAQNAPNSRNCTKAHLLTPIHARLAARKRFSLFSYYLCLFVYIAFCALSPRSLSLFLPISHSLSRDSCQRVALTRFAALLRPCLCRRDLCRPGDSVVGTLDFQSLKSLFQLKVRRLFL